MHWCFNIKWHSITIVDWLKRFFFIIRLFCYIRSWLKGIAIRAVEFKKIHQKVTYKFIKSWKKWSSNHSAIVHPSSSSAKTEEIEYRNMQIIKRFIFFILMTVCYNMIFVLKLFQMNESAHLANQSQTFATNKLKFLSVE